MRRFLVAIFVLMLASIVSAAELMPPAPSEYVNDYAGVMPRSTVDQLNAELDQFERQTSNQIVVAIYPTMQSDSSIDDYTVRIANQWKAGRKGLNNGAILFVFIKQRQMFIQTGKGMEGALPDALCKQIVENEIKPRFRAGDFGGGVTAGVDAMMAATRGEYTGNGSTVHGNGSPSGVPLIIIFIAIFILVSFLRRTTSYSTYGRRSYWFIGPTFYGGGERGGFFGGGGGGGGGFTGGGGSFGGGGAGGSW